jgi:predicted ATPase/DNA-binding CsgD family transcriptional regulator
LTRARPSLRPTTMAQGLPQPLTSFIGREWELGELGELLRRHRLLTLVGAGGCGKTRLAVELARRTPEYRAGRVWFIDLAAVQHSEFLDQVVATTVDSRPTGNEDVSQALIRRISEGPGLLLLDTCEHLVGACSALVERLLRECPPLSVLATSRQPLGIGGELRWTVPSLSLPESGREVSMDELASLESVQLFMARARLVRQKFTLDASNSQAVAAICICLDGIPLAIELAAAWARVLAPAQILARLDQRFTLLGTARGLNPRHQTLEDAVRWSFDLLNDADRVLLRRLGVFTGSFEVAACEEICADDALPRERVLPTLTELVDQSMVEVAAAETRYRLLDTIRDYARTRLNESGELATYSRRHANFFLRVADEAYRKLRGPGRLEWQIRLELEAPNLRQALDWADKHDDEVAVRLAYLVAPFHLMRMTGSDLKQADAWLERALTSSGGSSSNRAWALTERGWLAWRRGDVAAAESHWSEALEAFREAADHRGMGEALTQLGETAGARGDLSKSKRWLYEGLTHSRLAGDHWMVAYALLYLGILAIREKRPSAALEPLSESLNTWQRVGDHLMTAYPIAMLGLASLELRDLSSARSRFEQALEISQSHSYAWGNAVLLQLFGALALAVGDANRAILLMSSADAEFGRIRSVPSPLLVPTMQSWLAAAYKAVPVVDAEALKGEGSRLTFQQAIQLINDLPRDKAAPPGGLSRREAEVAALVARGLASKEIAAQLNISSRTAETHVDHIRTKLKLKSKAQIAAWAVEHRLSP